jgi:hypothetical protein
MDSRCHAWAHLLLAAIKDATPQEAVGIAAGALAEVTRGEHWAVEGGG